MPQSLNNNTTKDISNTNQQKSYNRKQLVAHFIWNLPHLDDVIRIWRGIANGGIWLYRGNACFNILLLADDHSEIYLQHSIYDLNCWCISDNFLISYKNTKVMIAFKGKYLVRFENSDWWKLAWTRK